MEKARPVFGALAQSRLHSLGFAVAGADEGVRPYTGIQPRDVPRGLKPDVFLA
jgi:hypothetical protein